RAGIAGWRARYRAPCPSPTIQPSLTRTVLRLRGPHFPVVAGRKQRPGPSRRQVTRKRHRLIAGRRFELDHKLSRYPAAVLYLDALLLGPLTNLGRVHPVSRRLAPAACRPPGTAGGPAASTD